MRNVVLTILLVLGALVVYGQENEYLSKIIPPAPNAASLGKYVETPVNLGVGQIAISIPIFEMQGQEINVPITLSYHGGGIKVEDIASWVGLGFDINAGGVISRVVYGLADDDDIRNTESHFTLGGNSYQNMSKYLNMQYFVNHPDETANIDFCNPSFFSSFIQYRDYEQEVLAQRVVDVQPDVYFFNFLGYQGKIFIDEFGDAYTIPYQNLKITPGLGPKGIHDGWIIITPDGTEYTFFVKEKTHISPLSHENIYQNYTSSWYLSQIVSPNKVDTVKFQYSSFNGIEVRSNYAAKESIMDWSLNGGIRQGGNPCNGIVLPNLNNIVSSSSYATPENDLVFISTIRDNHGTVVYFDTEVDRLDFLNTPRLKGIDVINDIHYTPIKSIRFYNDNYFDSNQNAGEYDKRLKLDSLVFFAVSDLDNNVSQALLETLPKQTYKFEYHPTPLPQRFSKNQDWAGYYNGSHNNYTLIPSMVLADGTMLPGANRNANPEFAKACILTKITYPTGGYKIFEYEGNQASDLSVAGSIYSKGGYCSPIVGQAIPSNVQSFFPQYTQACGTQWNPEWDFFTFVWREDDTFIDMEYEFYGALAQPAECPERRAIIIKIADDYWPEDGCISDDDSTSTGAFPPLIMLNPYTEFIGYASQWHTTVATHGYRKISTHELNGPGTYQVLFLVNGYEPDYTLRTTYKASRVPLSPTVNTESLPGLRIKSILSLDNDEQVIEKRAFNYEELTPTTFVNPRFRNICVPNSMAEPYQITQLVPVSSGKKIHEPSMSNYLYFEMGKNCPRPISETSPTLGQGASTYIPEQEVTCVFINRTASSQSSLGSTGYHVGYSVVTESQLNDADVNANGFTRNVFYFKGAEAIGFPPLPPDFTKTQNNGTLLRQQTYSEDSLLLHDVEYVYAFQDLGDTSLAQNIKNVLGFAIANKRLQVTDRHWGLAYTETIDSSGCTLMDIVEGCKTALIMQGWSVFGNDFKPKESKSYLLSAVWDNFIIKEISTSYPVPSRHLTDGLCNNCDTSYIEQVKEYFYTDLNSAQIRSIKTTDSKGQKLITKYKYPLDYNYSSIPSLNALVNNNIIAAPIEEQTWIEKNGTQQMLSGRITEYDPISLKPMHIYVFETTAPVEVLSHNSTNSEGKYTSFISDARYQQVATMSYNGASKLKEQKLENDIPTSYLWGYNDQYPIAQVVNAQSTQIFHTSFEDMTGANVVSTDFKTGRKAWSDIYKFSLPSAGTYTLTYWQKVGSGDWTLQTQTISANTTIGARGTLIDEVRVHPAEAMMTTYTFDPLIGMTSQTDPNNQTMYYEYDGFGRLLAIKDFDGNILKTYEYHYKGE